MRLLDDGISGQPWQHGGQGPRQQKEGGAITSYGAGCAQFVGKGGVGGTLNCTSLVSALYSTRCSKPLQSLNHRKLLWTFQEGEDRVWEEEGG